MKNTEMDDEIALLSQNDGKKVEKHMVLNMTL